MPEEIVIVVPSVGNPSDALPKTEPETSKLLKGEMVGKETDSVELDGMSIKERSIDESARIMSLFRRCLGAHVPEGTKGVENDPKRGSGPCFLRATCKRRRVFQWPWQRARTAWSASSFVMAARSSAAKIVL